MDIPQCGAFSCRYQLPAQIIRSGDYTGSKIFLVILIDIENSLAAFGLFHTVAVAVPVSNLVLN